MSGDQLTTHNYYTTMYHYTSQDCAEMIEDSLTIKQSMDTAVDARYGIGVYLTKLSPSFGQAMIAENNYDGSTSFYMGKLKDGKAEVAFEIGVLRERLTKCRAIGRDVYLHDGDINFQSLSYFRMHNVFTKN